jgi:hypothetical protein
MEERIEELEIEWLEAYDDEKEARVEYAVTSNFIDQVMKVWAEEDAEDVTNDQETYIEGRADHLAEMLANGEMDEEGRNHFFEIAKREGQLIHCNYKN